MNPAKFFLAIPHNTALTKVFIHFSSLHGEPTLGVRLIMELQYQKINDYLAKSKVKLGYLFYYSEKLCFLTKLLIEVMGYLGCEL